jgi:hypothetical protein
VLLTELKRRLDGIAWRDQVEHELSERATTSPPDVGLIEAELRSLAGSVDEALLDALEEEPGYLVWALRLSPFVDAAQAKRRAARHLGSTDWRIRYWASVISHSGDN